MRMRMRMRMREGMMGGGNDSGPRARQRQRVVRRGINGKRIVVVVSVVVISSWVVDIGDAEDAVIVEWGRDGDQGGEERRERGRR